MSAVWDAVCLASSEAWFWHTSHWHEYTVAYNPALKSRTCSFMVLADSVPVSVIPLLEERYPSKESERFEFSFGGGWCPSPASVDNLSHSQKKEIETAVFERIDQMALASDIRRVSFRSNPFASIGSDPSEMIPAAVRFGYTTSILPTQIVDVRQSPSELLKSMRKGHRSCIHKAEKLLNIEVFSNANPSRDVFEEYCAMHYKAAGKQTRPRITFDLMFDWIRKGYGCLFAASMNGKRASFAYVFLYKGNAYYGSACNDPELRDLPLAHFLQWEILKWLHTQKFSFYEIGWQFYAATPSMPASEKELAISHFKRGFGGFTIPITISELVASRNFLAVQKERLDRYLTVSSGAL